jgi:hypothetical protein
MAITPTSSGARGRRLGCRCGCNIGFAGVFRLGPATVSGQMRVSYFTGGNPRARNIFFFYFPITLGLCLCPNEIRSRKSLSKASSTLAHFICCNQTQPSWLTHSCSWSPTDRKQHSSNPIDMWQKATSHQAYTTTMVTTLEWFSSLTRNLNL